MDEATAAGRPDASAPAWSVAPAPEEDELAALVVAVAFLIDRSGSASAAPAAASDDDLPSAWALAGRRAAHRGRDGGLGSGWGRTRSARSGT